MTGGLDTRVILASHPPAPGSLPSYTFGSNFRASRDVVVGRQIASICKQPHQVIEVGNEFLKGFPDYAQRSTYITEGTVDVSRASDLYVSEKVRGVAPAKIVGTTASRFFAMLSCSNPKTPWGDYFLQTSSPWFAMRRPRILHCGSSIR